MKSSTASTEANNNSIELLHKQEEATSIDALTCLLETSDIVFVKKMSLNDWQWTEKENKHQNGPLIPKAQRDSSFFPSLKQKPVKPGKPQISEALFKVLWPQTGEILEAKLTHYTSKNESHLTHVPRLLFTGIAPASLFVVGHKKKPHQGDCVYQAVILDSVSEDADSLIDLFELPPTFLCDIFVPQKAIKSYQDKIFEFIEKALVAFNAGDLKKFAKKHATLPKPEELAVMAQQEFKRQNTNILNFNPFILDTPGDCLMEISRGIELAIFREFELRQKSLELIQVILGDKPQKSSVETAFRNIIREFPRIDKLLLSASQSRKSRAGRSYEYHIETMLIDGKIPYKPQVVMSSKSRPDFILPTLELYNKKGRPHDQALVLSAKTTLRERWKQVQNEIKDCDLYLATCDDKIAESAITSMKEAGIRLVVPESLKSSQGSSKIVSYKEQGNVISFKTFFH